MKKNQAPNSLINETSPYLLQHACNPVDWYPWSAETLDLARRENKPILLSIGYSACHWCHVMAHESFEDEETAGLMNEHFVNIKVDREERPDLDKIYQTAQQLLTGRSGGWPLTLFLTPDEQIPFFGGTYFPPESRYGMPGFKDILRRVAEFYHQQQDAIRQQNVSLLEALARMQPSPDSSGSIPDAGPLMEGIQGLINSFDSVHGGFGGAPKFPQVSNLELLLNYACLEPEESGKTSLDMAALTLEKMANGGIYDHLAGGFCRYSVDDTWMIPHFEKMLYDNGPLLAAYSQAWHLTGNFLFRQVAAETANWILTDMQSPSGGFYSSLDADSEGVEGKFYVWTRDEVQSILDKNEYDILALHYGLAGPANFEGKWHLRTTTTLEQVASHTGTDINEAVRILNSARKKLLAVRRDRVWPGRDEKILVSWNALTIKGMAVASVYLDSREYYESAEKSLAFIHDRMWRDGRLLASCKDDKAHLNAYLDDYAYLLDAIITLLAVHWQSRWLDFAFELADVLLNRFYNADNGGFFFTSHDHEKLLQRRQDFMDDATPSGNGVAARALLQLGNLTGRQEYIDAATATIAAAWPAMQRIPHAHNSLLLALADLCYPPRQLIIRGAESGSREWQRSCYQEADIRTAVHAIPDEVDNLKGLLAEKTPRDRTVAYMCEGFSCRPPYIDLENLLSDLKPAASR